MSTAGRGGAAAAMVVPTRVARLALRPTVRSMSWLPLLVGAASAGAGMWLTEPWGSEIGAFTALRLTAFLLAAGAAFALDDPTTTTLAACPTALGARRGLRLALLGGVWIGLWALALAVISTASPHGGLAVAGPTVEAAGMLALTLAAAAISAPHVSEGRGGVIAASVLTVAMLGALMAQAVYPRWATLFALSPTAPEWHPSHARWSLLLVAGMVAVVIASRDPARRSLKRIVIRSRRA